MTNEQDTPVTGTLLCGAEDALYFIPDRDLAAYRLAEKEAGEVRALLDGRSDVGGFGIRPPIPFVSPLLVSRGTQGVTMTDCIITSVRTSNDPA